jgi:hypothetical protein
MDTDGAPMSSVPEFYVLPPDSSAAPLNTPLMSHASLALNRLQLSECLSLAQAGHASSLYIPLACPWQLPRQLRQLLRLDPSSTFQTAAVLAAAVDAVTLPCRLTGEEGSRARGVLYTPTGLHTSWRSPVYGRLG